MLRAYIREGDRLVPTDFDPAAGTELTGAVWYSLTDPSRDEDKFVEACLGIDIPTRREMQDIEPSARLYSEAGAEFMTITCTCTPEAAAESPAVVHLDGTARPQVIRREIDPFYYDVLARYHQRTGIPSLVNTSFNMHEEPIVCSPDDAVRSFLRGNIDTLVLGPFLVDRPHGSGPA